MNDGSHKGLNIVVQSHPFPTSATVATKMPSGAEVALAHFTQTRTRSPYHEAQWEKARRAVEAERARK